MLTLAGEESLVFTQALVASAHTHTHHMHIFFGLNLRVLQGLPVATSPSSLADFKTKQKTMDI